MIGPRIYVACLAAYSNGKLHGAWIGADQNEWAIETDIQKMLSASPIAGADEWAIHDFEGFEGACVPEHAGVQTIVKIARFVSDHGAKGVALLDYYGGDIEEAEETLTDRYLGFYESTADYIESVMSETVTIPESLRFYIDWRAMARDAELSGEIFAVQTAFEELHIFGGYR